MPSAGRIDPHRPVQRSASVMPEPSISFPRYRRSKILYRLANTILDRVVKIPARHLRGVGNHVPDGLPYPHLDRLVDNLMRNILPAPIGADIDNPLTHTHPDRVKEVFTTEIYLPHHNAHPRRPT